jgi:glycosyltransferase involved in cell wall biosynthesis
MANGTARPKLLFLAADFPLPVASGSQVRQMNLLTSLSRIFDVTLIAPSMQDADLEHVAALEQLATRVVTVRPDNKRGPLRRFLFKLLFWVRRYTLGDSKDRFYNAMPSITRAVLDELQRQPPAILLTVYWYWDERIWETPAIKVIDANDVQSHRVERLLERTHNVLDRLLKNHLVRRYRGMEASTLRKADLIVAITERDRVEFAAMTHGRVPQIVVPTGLDTDWFQSQGEPEPNTIGFFGSMRNPMNHDAVLHLIEDLWPLLKRRNPDLKLRLIGAGAAAELLALVEKHPDIECTGYVEDVRLPICACQVIILPLRIGWGIRGRVYEVMSLGVPVIATPIAVEGMGLVDGEGILLAAGVDAVADQVDRLLEEPARRRALGAEGRRVAIAKASFAATYDRLSAHLQELAGRSNQSASRSE